MIHLCTFLSLHSPHRWAYSGRNLHDDAVYHGFARCMVGSAARHQPGAPLHLLAINVLDDELSDLCELNGDIKPVRLDADFAVQGQAEWKGWLVRKKIDFIRTLLCYRLGEGEVLCYLDIDCMLRGSLDAALTGSTFDVACHHRAGKSPFRTFNVGVLFLRNNPRACGFLREWAWALPKENGRVLPCNVKGNRTVSYEQYHFYGRWAARRDDVDFWLLPREFNDGSLGSDALIWHGNRGDKVERLRDFEREVSRV